MLSCIYASVLSLKATTISLLYSCLAANVSPEHSTELTFNTTSAANWGGAQPFILMTTLYVCLAGTTLRGTHNVPPALSPVVPNAIDAYNRGYVCGFSILLVRVSNWVVNAL